MDVRWHLRKLPWHVRHPSEFVTPRLPLTLADRRDFRSQGEWRSPLNGQQFRRKIIDELDASFAFTIVVETGSFRGATTELFAEIFDCPIYTVESDPRFFKFVKWRLRKSRRVHVTRGDSRSFLRRLAAESCPDSMVFAYLDAHWGPELPLAEELEIVAGAWKNAVVMIDDFEVPDDPGYGFDDYGPGRVLNEEYLRSCEGLHGWTLRYPALPSAEESGAKRGCCVVTSPSLGNRLATLRGGSML
jgi:hypothetical protein